jgi:hypothetical protein
MRRGTRVAVLIAAVLVVAVSGMVFATRQPPMVDEPAPLMQDDEGPPTAEELAHAAERLRANRVAVEDAVLSELASEYGLGGAIRIVAWSADNELGLDIAAIRAKRDGDGTDGSGMGWGQIAKELGVSPGLGSIMGNGGGRGREDAPGHQDDEAP